MQPRNTLAFAFLFSMISGHGQAQPKLNEPAFRIGKKATPMSEVYEDNKSEFYDLEKKKYQIIEQQAYGAYLDHFWQTLAKKEKNDVDAARSKYMAENVEVSDAEVKDLLEKLKDNPQLKDLSVEEQKKQIHDYLRSAKEQDVLRSIIADAKEKKEFEVLYPMPEDPIYEVKVTNKDIVRYGPQDTKPIGCQADDCPITVVEYSEFQCPFCERALDSINKVLTEYKGKIRWINRDFPLSFHDRAIPAAVAAHCAGDQGKYWQMYEGLFENQKDLSDENFHKIASKIDGISLENWKSCVKNAKAKKELIQENMQSGIDLGVTGTPAFFINGRRLSGALPYSEFKRVIEEELAKQGQKES